jgi:nucleotide-binding universal stress UspA family protein
MERLLVPTDGSEHSQQAVTQAVQIAEPFDAAIHVLAVVDSDPNRDRLRHDPEVEAKEAIAAATNVVEQAGVEFTDDTRVGLPSEQILEYADDRGVDMIVMGTHGRSGLSRVLIGSVAERTVRNSDFPVLVVPAEE